MPELYSGAAIERIRIEANEHTADDAGEGGGYQKPKHVNQDIGWINLLLCI
jgi:hypothetical protein